MCQLNKMKLKFQVNILPTKMQNGNHDLEIVTPAYCIWCALALFIYLSILLKETLLFYRIVFFTLKQIMSLNRFFFISYERKIIILAIFVLPFLLYVYEL